MTRDALRSRQCRQPTAQFPAGPAAWPQLEMRRSGRRRSARLERSELRTSSDAVIGGGGAPEPKLTASDTDLQESVDNRTAGREQDDHVIEVSVVVEAPDPGGVWRARVRQRQHGHTRTQQREGQQRAQARRSHSPVKYHPKARTVNAICGVLRHPPSRETKPRFQHFFEATESPAQNAGTQTPRKSRLQDGRREPPSHRVSGTGKTSLTIPVRFPAIGARGTARSRILCDLTIRQGEYRPGPRAPAVRTARPERPDVTAARRWCCRRSSRW
jgi:hypothetical protein